MEREGEASVPPPSSSPSICVLQLPIHDPVIVLVCGLLCNLKSSLDDECVDWVVTALPGDNPSLH